MTLMAGKLRHRVLIQRKETMQDPVTGSPSTAWVDLADVWAAIEPLSAREFIQSASMQAQITARVTIRYRQDINAACRIVHVVNGLTRLYDVQGVLADKDSGLEYLTLPVSEGVNEGG